MSGSYRFMGSVRDAVVTLLSGLWFVIVSVIWTVAVVGSLLVLSLGLAIGLAYIDPNMFIVGATFGCAIWYFIMVVMMT